VLTNLVESVKPQNVALQQRSDALSNIANKFPGILHYPKNASKTVYVEGLPADCTEREMAHIFRPFPGFK